MVPAAKTDLVKEKRAIATGAAGLGHSAPGRWIRESDTCVRDPRFVGRRGGRGRAVVRPTSVPAGRPDGPAAGTGRLGHLLAGRPPGRHPAGDGRGRPPLLDGDRPGRGVRAGRGLRNRGGIFAGAGASRFWFGADYLLWRPKSFQTDYPFVTTSAPADLGVLGRPSTCGLCTDKNIAFGSAAGFRVWGGMALDDAGTAGIEVRRIPARDPVEGRDVRGQLDRVPAPGDPVLR